MVQERALFLAPMMGLSDAHYRRMMRILSPKVWIFTEMIVDGSILHCKQESLLSRLGCIDDRTVVQVGGSNPDWISKAISSIKQLTGCKNFNLNVGCPSERVQKALMGAILMRYPEKVVEIARAVQEQNPDVDFSIKCRLGVDELDSFEFFERFIRTLISQTQIRTMFIHARKALLSEGISTHQNHKIPPLRYDFVYKIAEMYPQVKFVLNGGLTSNQEIEQVFSSSKISGVMIGRWPYENDPMAVATLFPLDAKHKALREIEALEEYAASFPSPTKDNLLLATKPMVRIMRKGMFSGKTKWFNRNLMQILAESSNSTEAFDRLLSLPR